MVTARTFSKTHSGGQSLPAVVSLGPFSHPKYRLTEHIRAASFTMAPTAAVDLKQTGNDCYKRGQYGQAAAYYSEAIKKLEAPGKRDQEQLGILYSNRAAAFLKDGKCSECIKDCTTSLELVPYEVKPLIRRASAYESLERYSLAYVDYKTALQVDNSVQAAHDGTNRMTKALMEQYGPGWREKIPKSPSVPLSAQKNWQSPSPFNISADENRKSSVTQKDSKRPQSTGATREAKERGKALKEEGNIFVKKGDFRKAVEKYTASLQLDSSECTTYTNRALCYLSLKQYGAAVEDCTEALRLDPKNIKGLYRRAQALKELKDYKACTADINRLLKMEPDNPAVQKLFQEVKKLSK